MLWVQKLNVIVQRHLSHIQILRIHECLIKFAPFHHSHCVSSYSQFTKLFSKNIVQQSRKTVLKTVPRLAAQTETALNDCSDKDHEYCRGQHSVGWCHIHQNGKCKAEITCNYFHIWVHQNSDPSWVPLCNCSSTNITSPGAHCVVLHHGPPRKQDTGFSKVVFGKFMWRPSL